MLDLLLYAIVAIFVVNFAALIVALLWKPILYFIMIIIALVAKVIMLVVHYVVLSCVNLWAGLKWLIRIVLAPFKSVRRWFAVITGRVLWFFIKKLWRAGTFIYQPVERMREPVTVEVQDARPNGLVRSLGVNGRTYLIGPRKEVMKQRALSLLRRGISSVKSLLPDEDDSDIRRSGYVAPIPGTPESSTSSEEEVFSPAHRSSKARDYLDEASSSTDPLSMAIVLSRTSVIHRRDGEEPIIPPGFVMMSGEGVQESAKGTVVVYRGVRYVLKPVRREKERKYVRIAKDDPTRFEGAVISAKDRRKLRRAMREGFVGDAGRWIWNFSKKFASAPVRLIMNRADGWLDKFESMSFDDVVKEIIGVAINISADIVILVNAIQTRNTLATAMMALKFLKGAVAEIICPFLEWVVGLFSYVQQQDGSPGEGAARALLNAVWTIVSNKPADRGTFAIHKRSLDYWNALGHFVRNTKDLVALTIGIVKYLASMVYEKITGNVAPWNISEIMRMTEECQAWMVDTDRYDTTPFVNGEELEVVTRLKSVGTELRAKASTVHFPMYHPFMRRYDVINRLVSRSVEAQKGYRVEPFCVYISGPAGVGKTTLANNLAATFGRLLNVEKQGLYPRKLLSEYWEGYCGQEMILIDEMFHSKDIRDIKQEVTELIRLVNTAPYECNMAFEQKGMVFFKGRLVVCTSNWDLQQVSAEALGVYTPRALMRRLHMRITVTGRPGDDFAARVVFSQEGDGVYHTFNTERELMQAVLGQYEATMRFRREGSVVDNDFVSEVVDEWRRKTGKVRLEALHMGSEVYDADQDRQFDRFIFGMQGKPEFSLAKYLAPYEAQHLEAQFDQGLLEGKTAFGMMVDGLSHSALIKFCHYYRNFDLSSLRYEEPKSVFSRVLRHIASMDWGMLFTVVISVAASLGVTLAIQKSQPRIVLPGRFEDGGYERGPRSYHEKRKQRVVREGINLKGIMPLGESLLSNFVLISSLTKTDTDLDENEHCWAVMLKGHLGVTVNHVFQAAEKLKATHLRFKGTSFDNTYDLRDLKKSVVTNSDLCFFVLPTGRKFKDIVRLFQRESDLVRDYEDHVTLLIPALQKETRGVYTKVDNAKTISNAMWELSGGDGIGVYSRLLQGLNFDTSMGNCGSVYLYTMGSERPIIGIHVLKVGDGTVYASPVTQEMIAKATQDLNVVDLPIAEQQCSVTSTRNFTRLPPNALVTRRAAYEIPLVRRNRFKKSDFFEQIIGADKQPVKALKSPARLGIYEDSLGNKISPCQNSFDKVINRFSGIPPCVYDTGMGAYAVRWLVNAYGAPNEMPEWTLFQAINGKGNWSGMDMHTSMGHVPSLGVRGTKENLFMEIEAEGRRGWMLKPEYLTGYNDFVRNRGVPYAIQNLKAELLPHEKSDKPRLFWVNALYFTIAQRQYFGPIISFMRGKFNTMPSKVGIDCHSTDWTGLYNYLSAFTEGTVANDGDFSSYDWSACRVVHRLMIAQFFETYMGMFNFSDERRSIMRWILYHIFHPTVLFDGMEVQYDGLWMSGNALTADVGSLITTLCFVYYFLSCETNRFRIAAYGDDNIVSVPRCDEAIIHGKQISDFFRQEFGMVWTSTDKNGDHKPARSVGEMIFLQRGFRREGSVWYAPRNLAAIDNTIYYWEERSDRVTKQQILSSTIASMLMDYFHHGSDIFHNREHQLTLLCARFHVDYPIDMNFARCRQIFNEGL